MEQQSDSLPIAWYLKQYLNQSELGARGFPGSGLGNECWRQLPPDGIQDQQKGTDRESSEAG